MSYVSKILLPGESIVYRGKLHWFIYLPALSIIFGCLSIAFFAIKSNLPAYHADEKSGFVAVVLITAFLVLIIGSRLLVSAFLARWTTEIAVTNRRFILKRGLIWRNTLEMDLDKVESVQVHQSTLGRIFKYGTIDVIGTGASTGEIRRVASPVRLRNSIESHFRSDVPSWRRQRYGDRGIRRLYTVISASNSRPRSGGARRVASGGSRSDHGLDSGRTCVALL